MKLEVFRQGQVLFLRKKEAALMTDSLKLLLLNRANKILSRNSHTKTKCFLRKIHSAQQWRISEINAWTVLASEVWGLKLRISFCWDPVSQRTPFGVAQISGFEFAEHKKQCWPVDNVSEVWNSGPSVNTTRLLYASELFDQEKFCNRRFILFKRAAWACSMRSALSAITIVYVCIYM